MYRSEKRSLYRFLIFYLLSTLILFSVGAAIFYAYEKHHLLDQQRESLKLESGQIKHQLMLLHKEFSEKLPLFIKKPYQCALFDSDRQLIFSTFVLPPTIDFAQEYTTYNGRLTLVDGIEPYHLGVAYIVMQTPIDTKAIAHLREMLLLFILGAGLLFLAIGYFLGRLFTAPMRQSIEMMNSFIQDTTHELNTPISTILTNLELIETLHKCDAKKEMQRIEIASKTLSRIYDDLTYLKLNHTHKRDIQPLDFSNLLQERLLYFASAIEAKNIVLGDVITPDIIVQIDPDDALRLIDNLLSNAVKYNRQGGALEIILTAEALKIKDSGIGIEEKELQTIFERFKRANKSEGGFGIGLHIVYGIVQIYNFDITITSTLHQGTEVTILW